MNHICYSTNNAKEQLPKLMPKRVRNQKVIDKLFHLGAINDYEYNAACKYFSDHYQANYYKQVRAQNFDSCKVKSRFYNKIDDVVISRRNLESARSELSIREIKIIEWVVVYDEYLKYCDHGFIHQSAYDILREGLFKLAIFYGFIKNNSHRSENMY